MTEIPSPIDNSGDHRFAFLTWTPEADPQRPKVPVTVFSGFLGSGKTTLIKHLLKSRPESRVSMIINDVGEVNIDAMDLRQNFPEEESAVQMISELTQGCICCSIGDELADALVYLLEKNRPDHIWIEASGVANPRNILQTFYNRNFAGHSLLEAFQLQNLITVVDASMFYREWTRASTLGKRRTRIFLSDPRHPYIELIMDQVETSDVLVLNKTDLLSPEELLEADGVLAGLNPRAARFCCAEGELEPALLLDEQRFELQATQRGATIHKHLEKVEEVDPETSADEERHEHDHKHGHEHQHHPSHGLDTVIFRARQPAKQKDLFRVLRTELPGVVRAKGFYWTAEDPAYCGILSLAGGVLRADAAGYWFIDMVQRGESSLDDMTAEIQAAWEPPPIGDRRQEIVMIGVNLNKQEILDKLNGCLI